jgi:hypothetical protein
MWVPQRNAEHVVRIAVTATALIAVLAIVGLMTLVEAGPAVPLA